MTTDKKIIDVCCGSKMFWFEKNNPNVVFADKRSEKHILCDGRSLEINPDIQMDFTDIPFADNCFSLVVFDPPHIKNIGQSSWMAKKYGKLFDGWEDQIREGLKECFRILKPNGVLIFKWNEYDIPVSKILSLQIRSHYLDINQASYQRLTGLLL